MAGLEYKYIDKPKFHGLSYGDTFTLNMGAFSCASNIWNNPRFHIIRVQKKRLRRRITLFGREFSVPCLRKEWALTIVFVGAKKK